MSTYSDLFEAVHNHYFVVRRPPAYVLLYDDKGAPRLEGRFRVSHGTEDHFDPVGIFLRRDDLHDIDLEIVEREQIKARPYTLLDIPLDVIDSTFGTDTHEEREKMLDFLADLITWHDSIIQDRRNWTESTTGRSPRAGFSRWAEFLGFTSAHEQQLFELGKVWLIEPPTARGGARK